ncbi:MAG: glycoside hydrolase family 32 protein [Lachnospiraceae bacterium]|nr:glycoside hydrolase family 32 protein [Lachnospiraceae bacterium]
MERQIEISEKLQKARTYEEQALKKDTMAPKQLFHVCAPVGWINDPNGFSEYQGEKHLFFQYYPYDTVWGPMHWGHVKTSDFIKWEHLPVVMAPDETYDGFGCFSGSALEWKGQHVLVYTGVEREEKDGKTTDYQRQCVAVGDGINYEKTQKNPVITSDMIPQGGSKLDFRDPKVWTEDKYIYMVVGNRAEDGSGQILMYRTKDLATWEFVTILDRCANRYGKMWECPDFFALEEKYVLMVSPQEMQAQENEFHAGDGSLAIIGKYDRQTHQFVEEDFQSVDQGLDFYAPQTMLTSDGRRIMIGWMQAWCESWFTPEDGFCGMMTIPRELQLKDGRLCQTPVRELADYYIGKHELKRQQVPQIFQKYDKLSGRTQMLELNVDGEGDYRFELKLAANDQYYTSVCYDNRDKLLTFDRSYSGVRRDAAHTRSINVLSNQESIKLQILMDRYSIELFVNDGVQTMTSVIRTPEEIDGVYMKATGLAFVQAQKNNICMK